MSQADSPVPLDDLLAHRGWVRALARQLVGDASRADDVEQEVWLTALRRPPAHAGSLRAWFGRLVRSRAHDARRGDQRRRIREGAIPPADPTPPVADVVARLEAHRKLVVALDDLPEPYRSTVLLRYYEDLPPRGVAARLDVPVETVRTRLKRAREMLRGRLDEDHGGGGRAWMAALVPLTGIRRSPASGSTSATVGPPVPAGILVATGILLVLAVGVAIIAPGEAGSPTLPREPSGEGAEVERAWAGGASTNAEAAAPAAPSKSAPRAFASLPPATGPTTIITARDLLDGSPIPDLRLRVRIGGEEMALVCDAAGRVGLPDGEIGSVAPEGNTWILPRQTTEEMREAGEIRLYRTIPVRGRVDVDDASPALNPTRVELVQHLGSGRPDANRWLRRHGIRGRRNLPRPGIDGEFHVRIAAIRGVSITASVPGYRSHRVRVPFDAGTTGVNGVRLVLERLSTVRGTLRTAGGRALPNHRITLYLIVTTTPREVRDGRFSGYALAVTRDGETRLEYRSHGRSGKDGTFALAVPEEGEAVLFVPPVAGHRPLYEEGIPVGRGNVERDLVLPAVSPDPTVRIVLDGEPLEARELLVSFLTTGSAQAEFAIALDADGRAPAGMFEPGALYAVRIRSTGPEGRTRLLDWRGDESEIDLSELLEGTKLSEARRRRADREDGK